MRKTKNRCLGLLLCFFLALGINGPFAQTLDKTVNNNTLVTYEAKDLPALTQGSSFSETPYWQVFYLFGDGNYYWRTGQIPPQTNNHLTTIDYFKIQDKYSYKPLAILIDRKTDNPPPPLAIPHPIDNGTSGIKTLSIDATNLSQAPSDDLIYYDAKSPALMDLNSASTERIDLRNSHFTEPDRWSSFILAYYPEVPGDIFFFFPDKFDTSFVFVPNYLESSLPADPEDTDSQVENAEDYANPMAAGVAYDKVLRRAIEREALSYDDPQDNQQKEELRLFHVLRRDSDPASEVMEYMAMITSTEEPPGALQSLIDANYLDDHAFISRYVEDMGNSRYVMSKGNEDVYFIDAVRLSMIDGEPKDPNEVILTEMIQCEDNNLYQVRFRFKFCNISPFPTYESSLFITDLTGGHVQDICLEPKDLSDPAGTTINHFYSPGKCGCEAAEDTDCAPFQFCNPCELESCIHYDAIQLDDTTLPDENCHWVSFWTTLDQTALNALFAGDEILKVCLTFRETDCELHCSPYRYSEGKDSINIVPGPCPDRCQELICTKPTPSIGGMVVAVLGVIAFLVVIFIMIKNWIFPKNKP